MEMGYDSELARQKLDGYHRDAEIDRLAFGRRGGLRPERRGFRIILARWGRGIRREFGQRGAIA